MPLSSKRCFVRTRLLTLAIGTVAAAIQLAGVAASAAGRTPTNSDWPQFLGPARTGISSETGLIDRWPEAGPKVVWRVPGGVGMSGLAVSRGRLFTMVQGEGKQWAVSLDAGTGESIWKVAVAPEYRNTMGNGPRATPTVSGDRVFVFTGEGKLAALDFKSGNTIWSHDVVTELSGSVAEYGMASSPLVVGDEVIVTAGAPDATLAAYDAKSGGKLWTAGTDPAGYSSSAVLKVGGREQIVAFTGNSAIGVAPKSGAVLWRYPYETNFQCNIVTPLEHDGHVFLSSGENHGSVMLELKRKSGSSNSADGEYEVRPIWESLGPKSVLRSEWQTPMLLDGYFYGMDNVGGAGPVTHLTCVKAASGERMWQVPRFGKGNLIAADGKLFISTMSGELVVARATPEKYDEIGRVTVLKSTRQAPSLADGLLYMRDDQEIVCIDVRSR